MALLGKGALSMTVSEVHTFVEQFDLDVASDSAGVAGGKMIVTGEWIPDVIPGEFLPWFWEERWAMAYVALIDKVFYPTCCTQGRIYVETKFKLYADHPLDPIDSGSAPPAWKVISRTEYLHGKDWISYETTPLGIGSQISKGSITVDIEWNCDGQASMKYWTDFDSPLDRSRLGFTTRRGREEELKPGFHGEEWVPFF